MALVFRFIGRRACLRGALILPAALLSLPALVLSLGAPATAQTAAPAITAVGATPGGYAIDGHGFGSDRSRVAVIENGVALPPAAILSLSDRRIEVRSATAGTIALSVRVGRRLSAPSGYHAAAAGPAPTIAAVLPTADGYSIIGTGFGADRARVLVAQNDRVLPPAVITSLSNYRIAVRGALADGARLAVRVGTLASAPFEYRAASRPPVIGAIAATAQGYAILGTGFGSDRNAVTVAENGRPLPAGAVTAVNDGRIDVRSTTVGEVAVAVRIGSLASPTVRYGAARPPAITGILRTAAGYAILGIGFGNDPGRVQVAENNAVLPRHAILRVADGRIDVRAPLPGAATFAVRVGSLPSAGFPFSAAGRAPTVTLAVPTPRGYTIVGSGFGTDRRRVAVIENDIVLPAEAIASLSDSEIVVRSASAARRSVAVQISGMTSAPVIVPAPLRRGPSATR